MNPLFACETKPSMPKQQRANSFGPSQVNQNKKRDSSKNRSDQHFERFYANQERFLKQKWIKIEIIKQNQMEIEKLTHNRTPRINRKSQKLVQERQLRIDEAESQVISFQQLSKQQNPNSFEITSNKQEPKENSRSFDKFLAQQNRFLEQRQMKILNKKHEQQEQEQMARAPVINEKSRRLSQIKQEKERSLSRTMQAPELGSLGRIQNLAKTTQSLTNETDQNLSNFLASQDNFQKLKETKIQMMREYQRQEDEQERVPSINRNSRRIFREMQQRDSDENQSQQSDQTAGQQRTLSKFLADQQKFMQRKQDKFDKMEQEKLVNETTGKIPEINDRSRQIFSQMKQGLQTRDLSSFLADQEKFLKRKQDNFDRMEQEKIEYETSGKVPEINEKSQQIFQQMNAGYESRDLNSFLADQDNFLKRKLDKFEKMEQEKIEYETSGKVPEINEKSRQIFQQMQNGNESRDLNSFLADQDKFLKRKLDKYDQMEQEKIEQETSGKVPEINKKSRQIFQQLQDGQEKRDLNSFLADQQKFLDQKIDKEEGKRLDMMEMEMMTRVPEINENSRKIFQQRLQKMQIQQLKQQERHSGDQIQANQNCYQRDFNMFLADQEQFLKNKQDKQDNMKKFHDYDEDHSRIPEINRLSRKIFEQKLKEKFVENSNAEYQITDSKSNQAPKQRDMQSFYADQEEFLRQKMLKEENLKQLQIEIDDLGRQSFVNEKSKMILEQKKLKLEQEKEVENKEQFDQVQMMFSIMNGQISANDQSFKDFFTKLQSAKGSKNSTQIVQPSEIQNTKPQGNQNTEQLIANMKKRIETNALVKSNLKKLDQQAPDSSQRSQSLSSDQFSEKQSQQRPQTLSAISINQNNSVRDIKQKDASCNSSPDTQLKDQSNLKKGRSVATLQNEKDMSPIPEKKQECSDTPPDGDLQPPFILPNREQQQSKQAKQINLTLFSLEQAQQLIDQINTKEKAKLDAQKEQLKQLRKQKTKKIMRDTQSVDDQSTKVVDDFTPMEPVNINIDQQMTQADTTQTNEATSLPKKSKPKKQKTVKIMPEVEEIDQIATMGKKKISTLTRTADAGLSSQENSPNSGASPNSMKRKRTIKKEKEKILDGLQYALKLEVNDRRFSQKTQKTELADQEGLLRMESGLLDQDNNDLVLEDEVPCIGQDSYDDGQSHSLQSEYDQEDDQVDQEPLDQDQLEQQVVTSNPKTIRSELGPMEDIEEAWDSQDESDSLSPAKRQSSIGQLPLGERDKHQQQFKLYMVRQDSGIGKGKNFSKSDRNISVHQSFDTTDAQQPFIKQQTQNQDQPREKTVRQRPEYLKKKLDEDSLLGFGMLDDEPQKSADSPTEQANNEREWASSDKERVIQEKSQG